jgi:transposase InsO family protein
VFEHVGELRRGLVLPGQPVAPPDLACDEAERVYRRAWPTRHELEMEAFSYIEGFYNTRRRHSGLDNLSPAAYEQRLTERVTQNEASA